MSYSKSFLSTGREVVNRSTSALVASVNRPPHALDAVAFGVLGDREEDFFREVRLPLEEVDAFV